MKATFNFNHAITNDGILVNAIVEMELKQDGDKYRFSASAYIYHVGGSMYEAGQCLDGLYIKHPLFEEILQLWKSYHLNDLHAGTPKQTEALKTWREKHPDFPKGYDPDCDILNTLGLLTDEWEGKPYRYGTAWINYPIPDATLKRIREIIAMAPLTINLIENEDYKKMQNEAYDALDEDDQKLLDAFRDATGNEDATIDAARQAFCYKGDAIDWVEQYMQELGYIDKNTPRVLLDNINWQGVLDDIIYNDDITQEGEYIFDLNR